MDVSLRKAPDLDLVVAGFELVRLDPEQRGGHLEEDLLRLGGRQPGRIPGHVRRAARDGTRVERRRVGVGRHHMDAVGRNAELLGHDLREDGQRTPAPFPRSR